MLCNEGKLSVTLRANQRKPKVARQLRLNKENKAGNEQHVLDDSGKTFRDFTLTD